MRRHAGHARGGHIETDVRLLEGARVTVITGEVEERFVVGTEDEEQLLLAIKEAEQGDVVPVAQVLEALRQL